MPTDFTPFTALIGGVLIGLAATLLYAGIGRIAGISGIFNSAIEQRSERSWRVAFLAGLILAASAWLWWSGATARTGLPMMWLIIAGLLVGFGTRLGNGCTSGHGICGLARWSRRSFVAVIVFMASGVITVYLMRHVWGVLS